jgi:hypothetical protein
MKKVLFLVAIAAFTMTSCKKDYTCQCVDTDRTNPDDFSVKYSKVKKKDAQKSCDAVKALWEPEWTCTLK